MDMEKIVQTLYDIVWSPVLVVLLVGAGLYFTIRTRCVQLRRFPEMARLLFGNFSSKKESSGITSFEAFCISLSGRVGTGNVVGVATAIALGGPGAVFWMWIIAFMGASTAFVEATLAQKYKSLHGGLYRGGPFSYIEHALHQKWLAVIFSIFCIIGYGALLAAVQSNSVASAFDNAFHIDPTVTATVIAVMLALVIIGGIKRIAKFASIVTPFMALAYIAFSLVIVAMNWRVVPDALALIFKSAFGFGPAFGGMLGSAISMGIRRGLFSNEAGQGGGAIVAASADTEYPAQQGLAQAFSVYVDTLLVCTATAMMIICTGNYNVFDKAGNAVAMNAPELGANYVSYAQASINSVLNGVGGAFVSIALAFFVFTTLVAYYLYAESSIFYLFKKNRGSKFKKIVIWVYRMVFFAMIIIGASLTADYVWTLGDIGVGLTTWVNVIALLIICPEAIRCLKDYEAVLKAKKG